MLTRAKESVSALIKFIQEAAKDERIPDHDKKMLLVLIALIISPIDIIPDWIPIFGQVDDLILLALILDYFFTVLDDDILLSHYPWSLTSFLRVKRVAKLIASFSPPFIKNKLWTYAGDPYKQSTK